MLRVHCGIGLKFHCYLSEDGDIFQNSSGNLICQALVKNYDSVVLKPLEQYYALKLAVVNALKSLLTLSVSAKMTALESMFLLIRYTRKPKTL